MPLRSLLALVVLAGTACGGGPSGEEVDTPDATAACSEAFGQAVEPGTDATTPVSSPTGGEEELDTATLDGLQSTLDECESVDDWLAGSREHPDSLPRQMDGITVLRFLCDASADEDSAPCHEMETPSESDELG